METMNMSEIETSSPFRSVKDAAAAFDKYDSGIQMSSPAYGQTSTTPVYYDVSVMDSMKKLEMELAEMRREMWLMKRRRAEMEVALAGINAQFHRSLSKLAEIEAAKAAQRSAIREEKRWEEDQDEYWPCFADALSICDLDIGRARRSTEMKALQKKPAVPLLGRIFSKKKKSSSDHDIDYSYPESIYSVLS